MVGRPIEVTEFYSSKKADVRIIIPASNNVSDDSDIDSDASCGNELPNDVTIPATDSESETSRNNKSKQPYKPARKKRILSSCISDRYASYQPKTKVQASKKLYFGSPSETSTPSKSVKKVARDRNANEMEDSEEDSFSLKLQLSQDSSSVLERSFQEESFCLQLNLSQEEDVLNCDNLSSPAVSPIAEWLNSSTEDMFADVPVSEVASPLAASLPMRSIENLPDSLEVDRHVDSVTPVNGRLLRKRELNTCSNSKSGRMQSGGNKCPREKTNVPAPSQTKRGKMQSDENKCPREKPNVPVPSQTKTIQGVKGNYKSSKDLRPAQKHPVPVNVKIRHSERLSNSTTPEEKSGQESEEDGDDIEEGSLDDLDHSYNADDDSSDEESEQQVSEAEELVREQDLDSESEEETQPWRAGDLQEAIRTPVEIPTPAAVKRPIEYFSYYFDNDILTNIVLQSNLYSIQKDGKPLNLTVQELKTFIGIWLYMGICSLPNLKDYWHNEMRVPQVADCMSVKRFQKIKSHIHISDNMDTRQEVVSDRLRKVRPLITHMQTKCRALDQEQNKSIDEVIIKYKGRFSGGLKQYNPKKPCKWGLKFFCMAGASGIAYDFLPYCGEDTFSLCNLTVTEASMGVSAKSVISLCKNIRDPESSFVYFDNWFNSLALLSYLKDEMKILASGTIRKDRMRDCPVMVDKEFIKRGRGTVESYISADAVAVVRWMDTKPVCLASTVVGVEPRTNVQRFSKQSKTRVSVPCPRVIRLYNQNMGGVDRSDQLVAAHSVPSRSKRWYMPIIGYAVDLAAVNGYLTYQREHNLLHPYAPEYACSKDFLLQVSKSLRCVERQRGRPTAPPVAERKKLIQSPTYRPPDEVRYDGVNHWVVMSDEPKRCKNCMDKKPMYQCCKCGLNFCIKRDRNCFYQWHNK